MSKYTTYVIYIYIYELNYTMYDIMMYVYLSLAIPPFIINVIDEKIDDWGAVALMIILDIWICPRLMLSYTKDRH